MDAASPIAASWFPAALSAIGLGGLVSAGGLLWRAGARVARAETAIAELRREADRMSARQDAEAADRVELEKTIIALPRREEIREMVDEIREDVRELRADLAGRGRRG